MDGLVGSRDFSDGLWLGFQGENLDATVDLGEARRIAGIGLDCLQNQGPWIFFPATVEFWVSEDGERCAPGRSRSRFGPKRSGTCAWWRRA